ncbi:DNA-directed RNA polymerase III subunit RPC9 isoform X2 [Caretta caretta]|uniref:DNA-directed RNA polymerase III subunit RPC9 isoform X2 n=1 Tax=Caretta caretta TaxID=8467 RepID=UPI003F4B04FC
MLLPRRWGCAPAEAHNHRRAPGLRALSQAASAPSSVRRPGRAAAPPRGRAATARGSAGTRAPGAGAAWACSSASGQAAAAAAARDGGVFQLLTDLKQQRKDSGKHKQSSGQQNLNTIMYETLKYISKTPCRFQSPEIVRDFLIAMKGHKLTKAEKLQLLNHRPMTAVEIQLMVEESEERLTEEQIESLLQTLSSILPGNPEEELQRQATMAAEEEGDPE